MSLYITYCYILFREGKTPKLKKKMSHVTCDFQQCGLLTSVDSDEPVQPHVKLSNSECCSVSSLTVIEYLSD